MNQADLEGKVVLVTGGSRGIGRAIVLGAIARGACVAFCARAITAEAKAVQEEAERLGGGGRVRAVGADVSREDDVEQFFDTTIAAFGRVDVAVNNAAISRGYLVVSQPTDAWDEVIATNLTGAFLVARRAVREFLRQGSGGRIVSLGSIVQNGTSTNACYAASKGGLLGLTHALAAAYGAKGIFANLVAAGYVETALSSELPERLRRAVVEACPQRRPARAEEIATTVLFLAADRALGVNGQVLFATGGLIQMAG